jgi:hypothetical protein
VAPVFRELDQVLSGVDGRDIGGADQFPLHS